ncbi:hypothetical protein [Clostridium sp.]|uniref:hypothetical protein n=1 Tax=Clostridium sp. TaxID=1506 RepID=UPI002FCBF3B4
MKNNNNIENIYEVKDNVVLITVFKKNGEKLTAKIDTTDLAKVKEAGNFSAVWNKDLNNYTAKVKKDKAVLSLESIVLDISPKAPIRHINGDTLDNRKCNLELVLRDSKNSYEELGNDTVAIILNNKFGIEEARALISSEDLKNVITDDYTWVVYKHAVISHTPNGRIRLDSIIMNEENLDKIHHINLNPLDNRRENLEIKEIQA